MFKRPHTNESVYISCSLTSFLSVWTQLFVEMFCIWAIIFIFHLVQSTSGIPLNVNLQNSTGVISVTSNNRGPTRSVDKTFNFKNWELGKIEQKLLLDITTQERRNRISIIGTGTGTEQVPAVDAGLEPRFEKHLFHFCLILARIQPPPAAHAAAIALWTQMVLSVRSSPQNVQLNNPTNVVSVAETSLLFSFKSYFHRVKRLDPVENYVSLSPTPQQSNEVTYEGSGRRHGRHKLADDYKFILAWWQKQEALSHELGVLLCLWKGSIPRWDHAWLTIL